MESAAVRLAQLRSELADVPPLPAAASALPGIAASIPRFLPRRPAPGPDTRQSVLRGVLDQLSALERSLPMAGPAREKPTVRAARRLNRAAGLLALSVLLDSAVEHYRGSFRNKVMITPIVTSALTLGISVHGTADRRPAAHLARDATYSLAAATGLVGTGFHVFNVTKRPGGLSWQNLFYGAPLGAPMAILLAGLLGYYSERLRGTALGKTPDVLGLPAGRALAALSAAGLLGTTAEAGMLHFRGAFQNPFMLLPVTLPPVAAGLLAETAFDRKGRNRWFTRLWLMLTAVLGFVGVGFHAYGVKRAMGGWRNWKQNLIDGPPLPAPPSFTGLALAGLAALRLIQDHPDA